MEYTTCVCTCERTTDAANCCITTASHSVVLVSVTILAMAMSLATRISATRPATLEGASSIDN